MTKFTTRIAFAITAAVGALTAPAHAQTVAQDVATLRTGWEHISYEVRGSSTQTTQLGVLGRQATAAVARHPRDAEVLLWQGIILSEQANRANIFHRLGLATQARDVLTRAYTLNPRVANAGPALSLAVLYYKVPGSPLAWGDTDRARRLLREALAADPDGLDTNYFYGDFLLDQGDAAGARTYLQRALRAPHDASRPVWDAGRRREVAALLTRAH